MAMAEKWEANRKQKPADLINFAEEARKVSSELRRKGIAAIQSGTLDNEIVYFAVDNKAARQAPRQSIVYTIDELQKLVGLDRKGLKQMHNNKKVFGGKIVK
ncbi:MAG: hypothetical protein ACOX1I_01600 [Dethiobacteria bacterium]